LINLLSSNQNVAVHDLQASVDRVPVLLELADRGLSELDDPRVEGGWRSGVAEESYPDQASIFGEMKTGGGLEGVVDELDAKSPEMM
jgi:hypothetical protein